MSFRTRSEAYVVERGESLYDVQSEYARRRRFLLARLVFPLPLVRNDKGLFIFFMKYDHKQSSIHHLSF